MTYINLSLCSKIVIATRKIMVTQCADKAKLALLAGGTNSVSR
jgi:hypothetical protein